MAMGQVWVVGHQEVERCFPLHVAIGAMRSVLEARARGETFAPQRQVTWLPEGRGALVWMPADLPYQTALGGKLLTVYPDNTHTPYETHQGVVLLFERAHGRLVAILEAGAVTAIRTAAVSAVATEALARPDAHVAAVLGTGTQARLHAHAMCLARDLHEVRIWGRSLERAERLAARVGAEQDRYVRSPRGPASDAVRVTGCATLEAALDGADIVCTTTASRAPFVTRAHLAPGMHINAVGAAVPGFRELDGKAVQQARVFVDSREAAALEADELRLALAEGHIGPDHVLGELGEVLLGTCAGRTLPGDITLFKSVGLAVEDVAAAHAVVSRLAADGGPDIPRVTWTGVTKGL